MLEGLIQKVSSQKIGNPLQRKGRRTCDQESQEQTLPLKKIQSI